MAFRLQINGLAVLVQETLAPDPLAEHLFAVTNRRRNRIKIQYWERNGFVLRQRRLERDCFHWPRGDDATVRLTGQALIAHERATHGEALSARDAEIERLRGQVRMLPAYLPREDVVHA